MKTRKLNVLALALIVASSAALVSFTNAPKGPEGPAYAISASKSTLSWVGNKVGGKHWGTVAGIEGNLDTNDETITGGSFTIDLTSVTVDDIKNEGMNKRLVGHLLSEDFFYTEKFPKAYFTITNVEEKMMENDGVKSTHMITGNLKIRGIENEISFPAQVKMDENMVYAKTGKFELDRTKWDVNFKSKSVFAKFKDDYINDEMIISMDLKFDRN